MRRIVLLALCAACSGQPTTTQIRALEAGAPPPPTYTRNVPDAVTNGQPIAIPGTCTTPCFVPPPNNPSGLVDSYANDVYERPLGKGAAAALYYPALDIQSTDTGIRPSWVYYRVNLVGTDAGALPHSYRVEINFDADAHGDALVELDAPSTALGTDWSTNLVVRVDDNESMGGPRALVADGPAQAGGGYEQIVFASGVNSAPGAEGGTTAVQARVSGASLELAIYRPFLESLTTDVVTGAGFRAYAALASINAAALYVHDDKSRNQLGSPYPWLETAGAPLTCPTGPAGDDGLTAAQVASLESGTRLDTGIPNPCYASGATYELDNAGSIASLSNKADVTFDIDLTLAISDAPDPVVEDTPLTYSLAVTNVTPGAGNAQNVVVTSTLPPSAAYVSAFPGCTQAAGVVTCVIGTLANGMATAVSITVLPATPGPITNLATVTSDGDELSPANNSDSEVTTVLSANPMCGDGHPDPGEACDDGNLTPNDGCENDCSLSIVCGNGVVQGTEVCDDGNQTPNDGCENNCTLSILCGNGVVQGTEACDDGNTVPNDGCEITCKRSLGVTCTSDTQCASTICDGVCEPANVCGNAHVEAGEICDDGNLTPNDGCEVTCKRSLGAACTSDAQCDSAICNGTCRAPNLCGNGELEAGESCDDGNLLNGDGCTSTCTIELDTDGDGVRDAIDLDDDNDGLLDSVEGDADTDADGVRNAVDLDSDNDGISDANEAGHGRGDTNGDFMIDCAVGFRPSGFCLALGSYTIANADGDQVVDYLDLDADNDGLSDLVEGGSGCTDVNDDGVCDRGIDTDHDGIPDSIDHFIGFGTRDALTPADTDRDGTYDFRDLDSDDDGRFDLAESKNATVQNNDGEIDLPDSDNDGIRNAIDTSSEFGGLRDARIYSSGDRADFQNPDDDSDGVIADNCPLAFNVDQADGDGDGIGDACDETDDRFGVAGGGCASTTGGVSWLFVLGIIALVRRRALLALLIVVPVTAHAQAVEGELAVERFQLASDSDGILDVESARVRSHLDFDLGLWLGYANDPLTVYRPTSDGPERAGSLVKNQVAGEFTAAIGLGGHLQLGAALPLTLSQSDDLDGSMFTTPGSSFAVGDVRAIIKLQLLHQPRHGIDLGVVTSVTFPTSSGDGFAGETGVTAAPALVVSRDWQNGVRFALEGGYRAREQRMLGILEVDDELFAGAGVAYDLAANDGPPLAFECAFSYATPADDAFGAFDRNYAEIKPGLAVDFGVVRAFVAGGAGVAEGFGTPDWRVLAGVRIDVTRRRAPPPIIVAEVPRVVPPLDEDGDGILGTEDKCPREPEDKDGFEDTNGCPDPDNDFDGVLDAKDGCPTVAEDKDGFQDDDGCPDFDNDGDKVLDGIDQCPAVPGPNLNNGCPMNDKDNDTVIDSLDNCPDWPGKPSFHGCNGPQLVHLTETQLELVTPIAFTGAKITVKSLRTLDAAALVLRNHAELKVAVTAAPARADAVRKYLVKKGIALARLSVEADGKSTAVVLSIVK
jgi:cysteine-rich repeat protein